MRGIDLQQKNEVYLFYMTFLNFRGQLAYCLQMQGREKEAQVIYNAILKSKPSDIGLVAVASNNSVTINRDQNVFDSKKKMKSATAEGIEHKLTSLQRKNIAFNQCLLTIYTNQVEHGRNLCQRLTQLYPECAADAALVQAVQLSRDNKLKEAAALLEKFAETNKDKELAMKLAGAQLLLSDVSIATFVSLCQGKTNALV